MWVRWAEAIGVVVFLMGAPITYGWHIEGKAQREKDVAPVRRTG